MTIEIETPLEPIATPQLLSDIASHAIQKHYHKSTKHELDVLTDTDPEPLHQMRVGMRRLRTALQVFDRAIELPKGTEIDRIRKFARSLGEVRDRDILLQKVASQDPNLSKSEQKARSHLLKRLDKQRSHCFKQLEDTLYSRKFAKFKQGFDHWLEQPTYTVLAQLPIQHVLPDLLLPLISEIFLSPAWLIGVKWVNGYPVLEQLAADQIRSRLLTQGTTLHHLRKQMKRLRYQAELFSDLYDDRYQTQIEEFKHIQDALGELQDGLVLQHYLTTHLDNPSQECPILTRSLDQTIHQAWTHWQGFQEHYLQAEFRNQLRDRILQHI